MSNDKIIVVTQPAASDDESNSDDAEERVKVECSVQSPVAGVQSAQGLRWPAVDTRAYASVVVVSGAPAVIM